MKAFLEHINIDESDQTFIAYHLNLPKFEFKWHYHPEYEITLITRGSGKRIVGDSFENFNDGDLVIIGPFVPHTWVSSQTEQPPLTSTVVQFSEKCISGLLNFKECAAVKALLDKSKRGLFYAKQENTAVCNLIKELPGKTGFERIMSFLQVLNSLSQQNNTSLASAHYQPVKGREHESRINKVCGFLQKNFTGTVSIHKTAALVHLSDSAFCRFFKRATGVTFSDYVNELRISHACHLLNSSDMTIAEIAADSGFESITYFNRIFLKKKKTGPREFRKINA